MPNLLMIFCSLRRDGKQSTWRSKGRLTPTSEREIISWSARSSIRRCCNPWSFSKRKGFACTRVKVNQEGWVDPDEVRAALTDKTILICVHLVNHDIGTIEPVKEVGKVAGELGISFFVDAVGAAGWLPIDAQGIGNPFAGTFTAPVLRAKGIGVLYRNRRARLASLLHGGSQEGGRRAGTENVPAIVGAGVAAEIALREMPSRMAHTAKLQQYLWRHLQGAVPYLKLNGPVPGPSRISTNLNISTEFVEGEGLALSLDMKGIVVASGPSCISKALKIPPVLTAIGLDHALAQGNIILFLKRQYRGRNRLLHCHVCQDGQYAAKHVTYGMNLNAARSIPVSLPRGVLHPPPERPSRPMVRRE